MEKKKVTAVLLAGFMASIGLSGLHAAADEVVLETESTETIIPEDALQVDSVEEVVAALGMDTETTEMDAESVPEATPVVEAADDAAIATTLAEETEVVESVTTTAEVALVQEESQTTVTTTVTPAAEDPVVTTIIDKPGTQGAVPLNYYDDIVLMLDVSGSMRGEPLAAMKEAAILVCNTFLGQKTDATISIVGFDSKVYTFDKTSDLNTVIANINSLESDSMTNIYDAMSAVKLILEDSNGEKKAVIIMTDGMPEDSKSDPNAIDYGYDSMQNTALQFDNENLKTDATVYSLGFFHNVYSTENAAFVRDLASDPIYNRTVENAEDLKDALREMFSDIPEEGKVEGPVTDAPVDGTTSTPKTADKGLGVIVGIMAMAGFGIVLGKRK